jgi:hypothetical protein|nr:AgmX/PglI C-terminal domain-containing protein [Kofleriaceae bacterium]
MATRERRDREQFTASRPRILRIGVLLGGKIVEERLIRERVSVSVGQSMRNTFSVPVDGLPLEFTLFAMDQGKYYLRFTTKMDGRLSDGGQVATLDQLRGKAQNAGDYFQIPLGESSRGKLSLGDLTVLFQFVTEPPRQPRPMLPASVRGTIADRIDPRLAVILIASLVIHIGFMLFALLVYDVELPDSLADRAYNLSFKQDTYEVKVDEPKPVDTGSAAGSATPEKVPEKKPDKPAAGSNQPKADPNAGRNEADDVRRKEEEATSFADLMTSDSGKDGKTDGDTNKRRPSADLGAQVADARDSGRQVAVGGNGGRGSRGNGDARVGNGHGPGLNGPGGVEQPGGGKGPETGPAGRITISDKGGDTDTSLSPDAVLRRIMALYMAQLQRCYKDYLKKDASARGKVSLAFTVNSTGRVVKPSAEGVAPEVSTCIQSRMGGWTFPAPKDKDGEGTEANFSITLQLVPD